MGRRWGREEWRERLRELGISEMAFALACKISMSTLAKLLKNDPNRLVHENTWNRAIETYSRLRDESKAAG